MAEEETKTTVPQGGVVTPFGGAPTPSTPTPTRAELNKFITSGASKPMPFFHAMDGSQIDPQSFDPTSKTTSWP